MTTPDEAPIAPEAANPENGAAAQRPNPDNGPIAEGVAAVVFLMAAFGSFLTNIAPPSDSKALFPVGAASVILLFVFLLIRFTAHLQWDKQRRLRVWGTAAVLSFLVFLGSAVFYYKAFRRSTFLASDGKTLFVKGAEETDQAKVVRAALEKELGVVSDVRLVASFPNPLDNVANLERVWTKASLENARLHLTLLYILVVVSIGLAILALAALL